MITINTKAPSEEEMEARAAEARKATAEGEFLILSEGKKKLYADSEALKKEIDDNKNSLEELKKELLKVKSEILDAQNSSAKEHKILADVSGLRKESEEILSSLQTKAEDERNKIKKAELDAVETHRIFLVQKEKDIKELEEKKKVILAEINVEKSNLQSLQKQSEEQSVKNNEALLVQSKINTENKNLLGEAQGIRDNILDLETERKKLNLEVTDLKEGILLKKDEVIKLNEEIEVKKEEYKVIENKAFAILKRSEELNQKELFIRSQFERAGVSWQE